MTRATSPTRRSLQRAVRAVHQHSDDAQLSTASEAWLRAASDDLRARAAAGTPLGKLLPEAFALVREATWRTLGMRHYDVQLLAGVALHRGNIAEMRTGEGKTIVAALVAYLHSLTGDGVHVVTANDYLAARDGELVGRALAPLGVRVSSLHPDDTPPERAAAYRADITYATASELGFDYLRDNTAATTQAQVQRGHACAIVDEIDSVLVDEARTPLILSGPPTAQPSPWPHALAQLAADLDPTLHLSIDATKRTVTLTDAGLATVAAELGSHEVFTGEHVHIAGALQQALRAAHLFHRDVDYVVAAGEVVLVDVATGRAQPGRRLSDGLHQALEAKEGLPLAAESITEASVSVQNYFRRYDHLCGMTGTAGTEALELRSTFGLGLVRVPTANPMVRIDHEDRVYATAAARLVALVSDVGARHAAGQPVLVGTTSVRQSEEVSAALAAADIPHRVLNAKQSEQEATVIARAGELGAVTVATNMAGRGTDILLGGVSGREQGKVRALGGLYVVGTTRHDSRRVDDQLRGRAGRQGDPGESRFYLSLEDDLLAKSTGPLTAAAARTLSPDQPLAPASVRRTVRSAQRTRETDDAATRRDLLRYDDVMDRQRESLYAQRQHILEHGAGAELVEDLLVTTLVEQLCDLPAGTDVAAHLREALGHTPDWSSLATGSCGRELVGPAVEIAADVWDARRAADPHEADALARHILVRVIDAGWREHLAAMDYLAEGVHLRAHAGKDPLVEYQQEAAERYAAMLRETRRVCVGYLLNLPADAR